MQTFGTGDLSCVQAPCVWQQQTPAELRFTITPTAQEKSTPFPSTVIVVRSVSYLLLLLTARGTPSMMNAGRQTENWLRDCQFAARGLPETALAGTRLAFTILPESAPVNHQKVR